MRRPWVIYSATLGTNLQVVQKTREGTSHPDRNAQFELINGTAAKLLAEGQPVISVDTKKKELVGDFKNAGREWQPKGKPEQALVHDFPSDALGKAIPYGIYDMARNEACVNVGRDHDTPEFAVASIRQWWTMMGKDAYPDRCTLRPSCPTGHPLGMKPNGGCERICIYREDVGSASLVVDHQCSRDFALVAKRHASAPAPSEAIKLGMVGTCLGPEAQEIQNTLGVDSSIDGLEAGDWHAASIECFSGSWRRSD